MRSETFHKHRLPEGCRPRSSGSFPLAEKIFQLPSPLGVQPRHCIHLIKTLNWDQHESLRHESVKSRENNTSQPTLILHQL